MQVKNTRLRKQKNSHKLYVLRKVIYLILSYIVKYFYMFKVLIFIEIDTVIIFILKYAVFHFYIVLCICVYVHINVTSKMFGLVGIFILSMQTSIS
jgi:hypothetical protein